VLAAKGKQVSKRTRGTTRDADRRRERHARRSLIGRIRAYINRLAEPYARRVAPEGVKDFVERLLGREVEDVKWNEDGSLTVVEKPRVMSSIIINFIIGPGPELNVERSRFLSVLQAVEDQQRLRELVAREPLRIEWVPGPQPGGHNAP